MCNLWEKRGGWRKGDTIKSYQAFNVIWPWKQYNPTHISTRILSLCLLYKPTFFMFPWADCNHPFLIYHIRIFKHIMFSNLVFVLCTLFHWPASPLFKKKNKKNKHFSTPHWVCVLKTLSTCSFITLFLKSLHPNPLCFFLSLSQICASSVRSVNLSVPTSLTAHPLQDHY